AAVAVAVASAWEAMAVVAVTAEATAVAEGAAVVEAGEMVVAETPARRSMSHFRPRRRSR
ncbi:MAG: hypothetical protein ACPH9E_13150, partial [Hyphomonas sp.]